MGDDGAIIYVCQGPPACDFDGEEPWKVQPSCHFCQKIYMNDDGSEEVVEPSRQ
jgi:hypothetical protein